MSHEGHTVVVPSDGRRMTLWPKKKWRKFRDANRIHLFYRDGMCYFGEKK